MRSINLSREYIENNNVQIVESNDGDIQIVFPNADFLVYCNEHNTINSSVFNKGNIDDTLPIKDLLCDQIQYVDYVQNDKKNKINSIDKKFRGVK